MTPTVVALLYAVGLALMIAELVTPGVVMGLIGLACFGVAVYQTFQWGALAGLVGLGASFGVIAGIVLFAVRKLTLRSTLRASAGYRSADPSLEELAGKSGRTETPLRPSGYCRFEGRRVGVVTRGEMLDADVEVRVIEVEGNRVVVRRA